MNKQRFLSLFLLVGALPLLAAFVLLKTGWYQSGVNNKGIWYAQEIRLLPASNPAAAHWRLVYLQPDTCDGHCQAVVHLMQQIDLALGRKQDQLDLLILAAQPAALSTESVGITAKVPVMQSAFAGLPAGSLIIVEHQGLALLHYPLPAAVERLPLLGKDVMADLQKLMKFDRGPV
ncbi:MAG: hypothetical protein U5L02_02915 [Rheinheimera sp.]|nr:hypothetical protein [Rheinheimera sp.]